MSRFGNACIALDILCIVLYTRDMSTKITHTEATDNGLNIHIWTMTVDGEKIGHLDAHTSGLILQVEIDEDHRGEGHARALYEHASQEIDLLHVPTWGRTYEGNAFAEAVGGDVMDDQEACDILDLDIDVVTGAAFAA